MHFQMWTRFKKIQELFTSLVSMRSSSSKKTYPNMNIVYSLTGVTMIGFNSHVFRIRLDIVVLSILLMIAQSCIDYLFISTIKEN